MPIHQFSWHCFFSCSKSTSVNQIAAERFRPSVWYWLSNQNASLWCTQTFFRADCAFSLCFCLVVFFYSGDEVMMMFCGWYEARTFLQIYRLWMLLIYITRFSRTTCCSTRGRSKTWASSSYPDGVKIQVQGGGDNFQTGWGYCFMLQIVFWIRVMGWGYRRRWGQVQLRPLHFCGEYYSAFLKKKIVLFFGFWKSWFDTQRVEKCAVRFEIMKSFTAEMFGDDMLTVKGHANFESECEILFYP